MPRASDFVPPLLTRAFKRSVRRDDPVVRRDGLFGDWCELNFKGGIPEGAARDLQLDYNVIGDPGAVTFIASAIAEFKMFYSGGDTP